MTYLDMAKAVLLDSTTPLRLGEIWNRALQQGFNTKLDNALSPSKQALSQALHSRIRREAYGIFALQTSPTLFGITGRHKECIPDDFDETEEAEAKDTQDTYRERDLHPIFTRLASDKLNVLCKTIYHEESKKKGRIKNKWLHPDIMGVKFFDLGNEKIMPETLDLFDTLAYKRAELYSFELKVSVNATNVRNAYFQAVSNSSWANYGYLAVFESIDDMELDELTGLNARFDIGVIHIDIESAKWEILIPAKKKEELDFSMINKLCSLNRGFQQCIAQITQDTKCADKSHIKQGYEYMSDTELKAYIQEKQLDIKGFPF